MPPPRIAVIGGVAAGPAAAAQAKRVAPDAEVVLYEQGARISYSACEMPYYVAGQIDAVEDLVVLTPEEFERTRGAVVRVRHQVLGIDPERGKLDVKDHVTGHVQQERFDKFILATGARARRPELDGDEAPNVFVLRRLSDAEGLRAYLEQEAVQHVVVLGAGYVGLEVAEALRRRGVRVTLLEPTGSVLGRYIDEPLQEPVREELIRHGVAIRAERAVGFEQDRRGVVRSVRTDHGERIGCQVVVAAIGVEPDTELAQRAGIACGTTGAVAVDDQMRTNRPTVWACGDCIEVVRLIDQKKIHLPLSPTAYRTARVAAHNAVRRGHGAPARFPGVSGASTVVVFGLEVATVGLRLAEARAAGMEAFEQTIRHRTRASGAPGTQPITVCLVVERRGGRLLGAQLVGGTGTALRANVLVAGLHQGMTVGDLADMDLVYAPPVAPARDPLIIAAHEAAKQARRW